MVFFSSRISPAHVHGDFLGEIAVGDGGGDGGNVAHLAGQVAGHGIDAVGEVLPGSGHAFDLGLSAQFSLRADFAGHAGHFRGEGAELVHHRVDSFGGAEELALQRAAFDFQGHGLGEVALGHGADDAGGFAGRMHQVADQRIDRLHGIGPGAGDFADGCAFADLSLLADHPAEALQFGRHPLVSLNHIIKGVSDFPGRAIPVEWQADAEVAFLQCGQGDEQAPGINFAV